MVDRANGGVFQKQIPTVSYDDMGTPEGDVRWTPFFEFRDWLVATFPKVYVLCGLRVGVALIREWV